MSCRVNELSEYEIYLEDIMVKFTSLMNAKVPKERNGTLEEKLCNLYQYENDGV